MPELSYPCPLCCRVLKQDNEVKFTCRHCRVTFTLSTLTMPSIDERIDGPQCSCDGIHVLGCPIHEPPFQGEVH